jgi:hypothetical protein
MTAVMTFLKEKDDGMTAVMTSLKEKDDGMTAVMTSSKEKDDGMTAVTAHANTKGAHVVCRVSRDACKFKKYAGEKSGLGFKALPQRLGVQDSSLATKIRVSGFKPCHKQRKTALDFNSLPRRGNALPQR